MIDRRLGGVAAGMLLVLAGACGTGGDATSPEAQPTPNVTTFEAGRFDDLPVFPRSEALGPRSEKGGVVARSFRARGTTPEQLLDYYRRSMGDGWTILQPPEKIGVGTYRGDWTSGEWQLRVSATEESELDLNNASREVLIQYSLTLSPIGGP